MNNRTYSEEFKKEAIRLAESSGKRVGEIDGEGIETPPGHPF